MKHHNRILVRSTAVAAAVLGLAAAAPPNVETADVEVGSQPDRQSAQSAESHGSAAASRSAPPIRVAAYDESRRTVERLVGAKVHTLERQEVGTVREFLVDAETGQVRFAVLSIGGFLGIGDKLHLVPFGMLQQRESDREFTASVTRDRIEQSPTLDAKRLRADDFAFGTEEQKQIYEAYRSPSTSFSHNNQDLSRQLIRATTLKGRELDANGVPIGRIDSVVVLTVNKNALALVEMREGIARGERRFLVPFEHLTFSESADPSVGTTLTSEDFADAGLVSLLNASASAPQDPVPNPARDATSERHHASGTGPDATPSLTAEAGRQPDSTETQVQGSRARPQAHADARRPASADLALGDSPRGSTGQADAAAGLERNNSVAFDDSGFAAPQAKPPGDVDSPSPTGATSAAQNPSAPPKLIQAAHDIRRALDADPKFAREEVTVIPQRGTVLVRGRVSDESKKTALVHHALEAAGESNVEFQLDVAPAR